MMMRKAGNMETKDSKVFPVMVWNRIENNKKIDLENLDKN